MRYWSPNLRSVTRGEWLQFDGERRIAVIREVNVGTPPQQLLRADTWVPAEAGRDFLGYFPGEALRLAAEMVWEVYQAALAATKRGAICAAA
ncbi:hypothetical protein [Agromyces sp. NPDC058104]|uniref:hypothetical protein n=1 Tax=Agromyces sp. NPDC058104 TaxID=3346342 RepID=UPI0036DE57E3